MTPRVAKVPGSKWRLADWYVAHLPARPVYLEPYFGSGAVLFNKPRSATEIVSDIDGRVVALFRCLRDRPEELARVVELTPWARGEWEACRCAPDADNDLELARQFLVCSWQSHGLRSLTRSGWRHDGPSGRRGKSVAREWADLPDKIMMVTRRLQGVHIENRPVLTCSYRNDLYDGILLGAGWVVEAQTTAEHGQIRVEALYLNPIAAASRPREQLFLLGEESFA